MQHRDMDGRFLKPGQLVQAPSPGTADAWSAAFQGTVHFQTETSHVIGIQDPEGLVWDVEDHRLKILE